MIFRGAFGLFYQKYSKKLNLFPPHLKPFFILWGQKNVFRGAYGGGLLEKIKFKSGVFGPGCQFLLAIYFSAALDRHCLYYYYKHYHLFPDADFHHRVPGWRNMDGQT